MALTPMKAIRAKCLDCTAGQIVEVRLCALENCPLHPYRMGHRPQQANNPTQDPNAEKTEASPAISGKEG
jgi:hypothetical protein